MKMEQGMQLIDGNGKFNVDGLKDFMTATEFAQSGLSYAIVAIIGSQSSGKSTLMNQTFHTNFEEMKAYNGRGQTTKGIWIAKCSDIDPFTIAMDFEEPTAIKEARMIQCLRNKAPYSPWQSLTLY
ncbi:hypothetical protein Peur_072713 [Populus x canadensis]